MASLIPGEPGHVENLAHDGMDGPLCWPQTTVKHEGKGVYVVPCVRWGPDHTGGHTHPRSLEPTATETGTTPSTSTATGHSGECAAKPPAVTPLAAMEGGSGAALPTELTATVTGTATATPTMPKPGPPVCVGAPPTQAVQAQASTAIVTVAIESPCLTIYKIDGWIGRSSPIMVSAPRH